MKIAVTSQNFKTVTNHAGKARRFIVYDVTSPDNIVEIERHDLAPEMAFHNFNGEMHPIDGIDVLISASFGEGFARKMAQRGIKASIAQTSNITNAIFDFIDNGQRLPIMSIDHNDGGHKCNCNCASAD